MKGSGLEDLFETIYAPNTVPSLMDGHSFSRAYRAHTLVFESLERLVLDRIDFSDELRDQLDVLIQPNDRTIILEAPDSAGFQEY